MKKIISLVLVAAAMLGLGACAGGTTGQTGQTETPTDTTAAENVFMAGYAQEIITPDFPVGLMGYGNDKTRISTGKLNELYVSVLAVRDPEGNTAVMISADLMFNKETYTDALAEWVEEEVGIPAANVIFSSIHQHSTPDLKGDYNKFAEPLIQKAIKDAVADLAPAEMYINSVETKALNFVRHYWNAKGEMVTDHSGDMSVGLVSHESEADNEMQLLKFKRGEDKKDIMVINFQTHPLMSTSSSKTQISADWVGVLRKNVVKELDCNVMYFSGAGGNLNSTSRIKEENKSTDFKDHGKRAANYVIKAEDSYVKVETGPVKVKQVTIDYEVDHSQDHLAEKAKPIYEAYAEGDMSKAKECLAKTSEFHSVYHAYYLYLRYQQDTTRSMTISAISMGDVAFTAHPYEMFDTNGMELKDGTVGNENYEADKQMENPYKMTIVTTIANGYNSYIPSKMGYTNGGYSTDVAHFVPGTGEQVVTDFLNILNELHG